MWLLDVIDHFTDWLGWRRYWRLHLGVALTFVAAMVGVRFFESQTAAQWFIGMVFVVGLAGSWYWHRRANDE